MPIEFKPFPKMARLSRECVITEKLDGTNAQIYIVPATDINHILNLTPGKPPEVLHGKMTDPMTAVIGGFSIFAGSRNRWITPTDDNYGFAKWVQANAEELVKLGPGQHFGEWWGAGIQRRYGLAEKRFSLFNASRWMRNPVEGGVYEAVATPGQPGDLVTHAEGPACCSVVPVLYHGEFCTVGIQQILYALEANGSAAAPGFMDPEGIVIYHTAAGICFKKTLANDASPKSLI